MLTTRKIELLAPAKNLECGIEAINHGADAIYIGAPKFSARAAAGNTIEDIATLAKHAHLFGARVYVALNTLIKEEELKETEVLIWDLYRANIDALIIQDMSITLLDLPPIPLHASTQCDNRTVERVKFMERVGFTQIVLARELTITEIRKIADEVSTPLEAFVHGALCVCYSGQCYLSEAISKRSANRGSCAQFCRLPYTLIDSTGETVVKKQHLLSMKDMNQSDHLEDLIDAGVSSLKIEGRMKDLSYVKNVVAYYRLKLDEILARRPEYTKASAGKCNYSFVPNLAKSFNRGFTNYFLLGRTADMWTPDSPKSVGEYIGKVHSISAKSFIVEGNIQLNNGDGLCFINKHKDLEGIRANRVEGRTVFPLEMTDLRKDMELFRNYDNEFEKVLSKKSSSRKISVSILIKDSSDGFLLQITDEDNYSTSLNVCYDKTNAQKSQTENIKNNLSKTGNTLFQVDNISIEFAQSWFIPSSLLVDWRRKLTDQLLKIRIENYHREEKKLQATTHAFPQKEITYLGNVMNSKSQQFYVQHQSVIQQLAFEQKAQKNVPLMFTRHCIKQTMGWCPKETTAKHPFQEPFFLLYNNTKLRLEFDCKACEMKVFEE